MSTPSPEKDTLFGPTVHEKIAYQILKKRRFFLVHPLYAVFQVVAAADINHIFFLIFNNICAKLY